MESLPNEILSMICESLPRSDMKEFWCASRKLREVASICLFREINLKFNYTSFRNLEAIANHRSYREHVMTVIYDPRIFTGSGTCPLSFEDWMIGQAGRGMSLNQNQIGGLIYQYDEPTLRAFHSDYNDYIRHQTSLQYNNAKQMLSKSLSKLPKVRAFRVHIVEETPPTPHYSVPSLIPFGQVAQKILAQPQSVHYYGYGMIGFWDLLTIFYEPSHIEQLAEISASGIDFRLWTRTIPGSFVFQRQTSALQRLSLAFKTTSSTIIPPALWCMLDRVPALRFLHLAFERQVPSLGLFTDTPQRFEFTNIIPRSQHWRNLESLSLGGIETTYTYLQRILKKYANSVRSLTLSNVEFVPESGKDEIFEYGSLWIKLFHFLSETMSLTHFSIRGTLSAQVESKPSGKNRPIVDIFSVGGTPRSRTLPHVPPPQCMKCRIERFATRKGPCPFIYDEGATVNNGPLDNGLIGAIPWDWDEDSSWWSQRGVHNQGNYFMYASIGVWKESLSRPSP